MARNIGTRKVIEVSGLKEMQQRIAKIVDAVSGAEMQSDMARLAEMGANLLERNAATARWPKRAIDSIFAYGRMPPAGRRRGPSALFGIRKRGRSTPYAPGYVEWNPGRSQSMRAKRLVIPGLKDAKGGLQKIGMSLATMFEFGTSKMKARPAMRQTIAAMRAIYPAKVAEAFNRILAEHTIRGRR